MTPDYLCGPILKKKRNDFSIPGDLNRIHEWNKFTSIEKRSTKYSSELSEYIWFLEDKIDKLKKDNKSYELLFNIQRERL